MDLFIIKKIRSLIIYITILSYIRIYNIRDFLQIIQASKFIKFKEKKLFREICGFLYDTNLFKFFYCINYLKNNEYLLLKFLIYFSKMMKIFIFNLKPKIKKQTK